MPSSNFADLSIFCHRTAWVRKWNLGPNVQIINAIFPIKFYLIGYTSPYNDSFLSGVLHFCTWSSLIKSPNSYLFFINDLISLKMSNLGSFSRNFPYDEQLNHISIYNLIGSSYQNKNIWHPDELSTSFVLMSYWVS